MQLFLVKQTAAGEFGTEEQVLLDGQLGHQRELLEDGTDALVPGVLDRTEGDFASLEQTAARCGTLRAGDDGYQCGFTGAILAKQDVDLAGAQVEVDRGQGFDAWKAFRDVVEMQERLRPGGGTRRAVLGHRITRCLGHECRRGARQSTLNTGEKSAGAREDS